MAILNEKNENTEKIIHLLVTSVCDRDCKYCCNKQYDLNSIPYVTDEELKNAEILCLTGGEPFLFSEPENIAAHYKTHYPNIKKVYVYTNADAVAYYLETFTNEDDPEIFSYIDGLNVSIKNPRDAFSFDTVIVKNKSVNNLTNNRLYVFDKIYPINEGNFEVFDREWQKDFVPADDSIFRRI